MSERVDLAEKLASFSEHWVPKVVAELNGQYVKLAKFQGEYVWHEHEHEDELFLVLKGRMRLRLRDRVVELSEGQLFVVPRGVEHRPEADEEVECLLFEPASTRNTGEVDHQYTIEATDLERI
jgi:mannose-6-phosphate isomerase-like protein (cupin superfamily)